ncbi:MAG: aminotransferase [Proteobacteria bacterium]|nr:aminotransferase [Pseudomonadota bacterium]
MSPASNAKPFNPVLSGLPTTIFETMSRLAREHRAVNLGQGFPDDPGAEDIRAKAAEALIHGWNQYPPMMGLPETRVAVAAHYHHHQKLDLDPDNEVMITSGATEAIAGALFALIAPGDEVVLFEPLYDAYLPLVLRAGGVPKFVKLAPPEWRFNEASLAAAFSDRTKLVLFNNPLNPAGTVCPPEDLALLARFCIRHDVIAVCDEVWEHVTFDNAGHMPLMALEGMRERTVKIGSAGKIFSLTGWKVGFVMAAPALMKVLAKAHQFLTFTTPPNLQVAVGFGLGKPDAFFEAMRRDFQQARDYLANGLSGLGFSVLNSRGTYFLNIDIAPLGEDDDVAFCQRLVTQTGVAAIPVSAFYAGDPVRHIVRLCFAKRRETLDMALERLAKLKR